MDFFVSPEGRDEWSGGLADPNPGRTDGPFRTLERARDAARAVGGREPRSNGDPTTVYLRGGTYFLEQPFVLKPEDSGTEASPVTYAAYEGEKPVISGGRRIGGWQRAEGGLWKAQLPEVESGQWYFRLLRTGNEWATALE